MGLISMLRQARQRLRRLENEHFLRLFPALRRNFGLGAACRMIIGKTADILTDFHTSFHKDWMKRFCRRVFADTAMQCLSRHEAQEQAPDEAVHVWALWWTGLADAPECVRVCVESQKRYFRAPEYVYHLLDQTNVGGYVELPEEIWVKFRAGKISITHMSDILRMALLNQWGGVWVDATLLMTGPLPPEATLLPLYTNRKLSNAFNRRRMVPQGRWTAYFWVMKKNALLAEVVYTCLVQYWQRYDMLLEYWLIDYTIDMAAELLEPVKAQLDAVPMNNERIFDLYEHRSQTCDEAWLAALLRENVIHKLSYKDVYRLRDEQGRKTVWQRILEEYDAV